MQHIDQLTTQKKIELQQLDEQIIIQYLGLQNPTRIGAGQFGRVYKANDQLGKYVAIKIEEENDYQQLEAAAAGSLNQIQCDYYIHSFGVHYVQQYKLYLIILEYANLGNMNKQNHFIALQTYGLQLTPDLAEDPSIFIPQHQRIPTRLIDPQPLTPGIGQQRSTNQLNSFQLELLKDIKERPLVEITGKPFLQLLSHMLNFNPTLRPSAEQLLNHHVFKIDDYFKSSIPDGCAHELGFIIDKRNELISQRFIPV
ncbi:MAG: hypothetical protein EZS28_019155 [Streblomastix strix]|uniref:non-specific serine/threonine protein kinase n=1 Tax=Streblomastix strix TaxID=222440 RepID=A0A5J4VSD0_9EUKA|nr:MAG: hypothetical protein EZS28_019155 [Streblomastix strix]